MAFRALKCPNCNGPLPGRAWRATVVCCYCGSAVSLDDEPVHAADFRRALAEMDERYATGPGVVRLGDVPYRVLARLGSGERYDVLLAERASPLTERVVLRVLRGGDSSALDRQWEAIQALQRSEAQGAATFTLRLPQPVARGKLKADGSGSREAFAIRSVSGFVHTLEDVVRAHAGGVDPRHAVWIWRRCLEILGFIHASGWSHRAIEPAHLLIHARDHGVAFGGWSSASKVDPARSGPRLDLVMSARAVRTTLANVAPPGPLAKLLEPYVADDARAMPTLDAWELVELVRKAAKQAFGPPRYVELSMPGWSSPSPGDPG
jgi:hypothetical protein